MADDVRRVQEIFAERDRLKTRLEKLREEREEAYSRVLGAGQTFGDVHVAASAAGDRMGEFVIHSEDIRSRIRAAEEELAQYEQLIALSLYSIEPEYRDHLIRYFHWDTEEMPGADDAPDIRNVGPEKTQEMMNKASQAFWKAWSAPAYSPFVVATILKTMKEHLGRGAHAREKMEEQTGLSAGRINSMIRLLKLTPSLRELTEEGRIPIRLGGELAGLSEKEQDALAVWMREDPSRRLTPELIRNVKHRENKRTSGR